MPKPLTTEQARRLRDASLAMLSCLDKAEQALARETSAEHVAYLAQVRAAAAAVRPVATASEYLADNVIPWVPMHST